MKKIILLILLSTQVKAFTVLNERTWCTGSLHCNGRVEIKQIYGSYSPEISKAGVILLNQQGFEGIEIHLGATHTFYLYNGAAAEVVHILKANLCDSFNKCFFYEKMIRLKNGEFYSETVYSSFSIYKEKIGVETIFADSKIELYPSDSMHTEAALVVSPFPYDR